MGHSSKDANKAAQHFRDGIAIPRVDCFSCTRNYSSLEVFRTIVALSFGLFLAQGKGIKLSQLIQPIGMQMDTQSILLDYRNLGMSYVTVPYTLYKSGAQLYEHDTPDNGLGILHIWLKFCHYGDSEVVSIRGFVFFESVNNPHNPRTGVDDRLLRLPHAMWVQGPRIVLQKILPDGAAEDVCHVELVPAVIHDRPFWLQSEFPLDTLKGVKLLQLAVGSRQRLAPFPVPHVATCALSPSLLTDKLLPPQTPASQVGLSGYLNSILQRTRQPDIHIVLPPTEHLPGVAVPLLLRQLLYHKNLGATSMLVYIRDKYDSAVYKHFSQNGSWLRSTCRYLQGYVAQRPVLVPYITYGQLGITVWKGPLHWEPALWSPLRDVPLVYNHALLTFVGRNAWVVLMDYDDFLVPQGVLVPEPVTGPPRGPPTPGSLKAAMSSCLPASPLSVMQRYHFACGDVGTCQGEAAVLELNVQLAAAGTAMRQVIQLSGRHVASSGRVLARADEVYGVHVHTAQLTPAAAAAGLTEATVPVSCLGVVTIGNLTNFLSGSIGLDIRGLRTAADPSKLATLANKQGGIIAPLL